MLLVLSSVWAVWLVVEWSVIVFGIQALFKAGITGDAWEGCLSLSRAVLLL